MKEALKLALEALEKKAGSWGVGQEALNKAAITAIKEALAQPEQPSFNEWTNAKLASHYFDLLKFVERYEKHGVTCQTFRHFVTEPCAECNCVAPVTAIKEALAPTSTQCEVQPEQEPVVDCPRCGHCWPQHLAEQEPVAEKFEAMHANGNIWITTIAAAAVVRNTPPPKRPWVGLTDAEMQALWDRYAHMEMMRAIEAKLKELNT